MTRNEKYGKILATIIGFWKISFKLKHLINSITVIFYFNKN